MNTSAKTYGRRKPLAVAALTVALALLSLSSCTYKNLDSGAKSDEIIRFSMSTSYDNGQSTRTVYTGEDTGGNTITVGSSGKERIDWCAGDNVRIVSSQTVANDYKTRLDHADYEIVPKSADASTASIKATSSPLYWGDAARHDFFAMYPSPTQNENASIETNGASSATLRGTISNQQKFTREGNVFWPDMSCAYMYAAARAEASPRH